MEYFLLVFIFFALIFDRLNIFFYFIVSSLLHEAGHILACVFLGRIPKVKFSIFGIRMSQYPTENTKKFIVVICGPLVNLILTVVSLAMLQSKFSLDLYVFMCINVFLFLFNMLPVSFMDGGQLLRIFVNDIRILKIAEILSLAAAVIAVLLVTDNIVYTSAVFLIFAAYMIINKNHLCL